MRIHRVLIAVAVLLGAALPAYAPAQVESTPVPVPGKPDFSSQKFLVGTWTCSTKSARRPAAYVTVSTYTMDPSGYWINETSTTSPNSWIPKKLVVMDKYTYDNDAHRWVNVTYGDGGAYGIAVSPGWTGGKAVWRDLAFVPSQDIKSQSATTYTKVSNTKVTANSSFMENKTGRIVNVNTTCTKH